VYLAGELAWNGNSGDSLASFYDIILSRQNSSSPVVAGGLFWSLFGHDVPDCSVCSTSPDIILQFCEVG
jgi:mannan endo-1,4-beta-mannosidase